MRLRQSNFSYVRKNNLLYVGQKGARVFDEQHDISEKVGDIDIKCLTKNSRFGELVEISTTIQCSRLNVAVEKRIRINLRYFQMNYIVLQSATLYTHIVRLLFYSDINGG